MECAISVRLSKLKPITGIFMKSFRTLFAAAVLVTTSIGAIAAPLNLAQFSGSESLIDFNSEASGGLGGVVTYQGVTFTAQSGAWMIQPSGGSVLGTTGAALNTNSNVGNGGLTLNFGAGISRFGMNFGSCSTCGPLGAVVTAYDANDFVVESLSIPSFNNSFVGFDFDALVSKIVIGRTDATSYFTFIDDVRFATNEVPEPGSIALIGFAALAGALARRRRKN